MVEPLPAVGSSDIAASDYHSGFQRPENGEINDLKDGLCRLLAKMTDNKVVDAYRREKAQRRVGNLNRVPSGDVEILSKMVSHEPDPALAVELHHLLGKLLGMLPDWLREVAQWRMQDGLSKEQKNAGRTSRFARIGNVSFFSFAIPKGKSGVD
jgi:hypothetical protein